MTGQADSVVGTTADGGALLPTSSRFTALRVNAATPRRASRGATTRGSDIVASDRARVGPAECSAHRMAATTTEAPA